jgi:hypothetical protein
MNAASFVSLLAPEHARAPAAGQRATPAETPAGRRLGTAIGIAGALVAAYYAVLQLWFISVHPGFDDEGLYNPIYLFSHAARATYPIYSFPGSDQAMFVHPPGDAVFVGAFQWLTGWPAMAAGIGTVLLLIFVALGLTAWSRFSLAVKLGLFAGIAAGLVAWGGEWFLRPDDRLAVSFIAGLIALETGRLAGWATGRLFLGAVLVCLSCTLHYPGSADVGAIAIYAIWVVRERRSVRDAARPLAALGLGSAIVGIPYVVLFAIPFWHDITAFAHLANQELASQYNGVFGAFRLHRDVYSYIYHAQIGGPFLSALASPFTRFGIPLVFVTTPILYWRRETRGIALGSLPGLLFLLLFTHTKIARNSDYYTTEFTLYYFCLAYLAVLAVTWAGQRLGLAVLLRTAIAGAAGAAALALVFFYAVPVSLAGSGRDWHPDHADMEIARAATASTLPSNSVVILDPALNLWYMGGGWTDYEMFRDIGYATDLSPFNLPAYFASATAVVTANEGSADWAVSNVQREGTGTWYADRLLTPFRFYFGRSLTPPSTPDISFLLMSAHPQPVVGNVLEGNTVVRYAEATGGSHVLAEALCDVSASTVKALPLEYQVTLFLPGRTNVDPYVDERQGNRRYAMQTFLDTRADYLTNRLPQMRREGCQIHAAVPLEVVSRTPASKVLDDYQKVDQRRTIKFPSYYSPAVDALYSPTVPVQSVPHGVASNFDVSQGASERFIGSGQLVTTLPGLYTEAGVFNLHLQPGRRNWVLVDGRVTKGQIELCVYSNNACVFQRIIPSGATGPFYLPVPNHLPPNSQLYIGNEASGSASSIAIQDVGVEAAREPAAPRHRASRSH